MSRPRDSQLGRVMQAENTIRTGYAQMQGQALQVLANKIAGNSWYRNAATAAGRTVNNGTVTITSTHRCQPMVSGRIVAFHMGAGRQTALDLFHSAAHIITPDDVALHGPQFAKNFLAVVQGFGSGMKRNALRDAFKASRVQYIYKSDEAKEAARQRAAEHGTPFTRSKVSRETQQDDLVAMMRELAGLEPLPEPEDPIERMLNAAKRQIQ